MAALTAGTKAPDFELRAMDGKRFVLRDELAHGPLVLAFFKVSCPTCQYAFPFLERLEQAYGHKGVTDHRRLAERSAERRQRSPKNLA